MSMYTHSRAYAKHCVYLCVLLCTRHTQQHTHHACCICVCTCRCEHSYGTHSRTHTHLVCAARMIRRVCIYTQNVCGMPLQVSMYIPCFYVSGTVANQTQKHTHHATHILYVFCIAAKLRNTCRATQKHISKYTVVLCVTEF